MTKPKDATPSSQKSESGAALNKNTKEIKKLLDMGVQRGFLTYVEVNELLPVEVISPDAIDEIMNLLSENEIEVIDAAKRPKESDDDEEGDEAPLIPGAAPAADGEE